MNLGDFEGMTMTVCESCGCFDRHSICVRTLMSASSCSSRVSDNGTKKNCREMNFSFGSNQGVECYFRKAWIIPSHLIMGLLYSFFKFKNRKKKGFKFSKLFFKFFTS